MKNLVKKGLAYFSLATALLLNPIRTQAQSLSFHIGNMLNKQNYTEIGTSLEGINITLEDLANHQVIAELTTDENGNAGYNFTSVLGPNYNLDRNKIRSVRVYDIGGRLEEILYNGNFRETQGKASGMRLYKIEDIFDNEFSLKSLNLEGEVKNGIIIPNAQEIQKYGKGIARTNDVRNLRLVVNDPDTAYFQFIDTLNIDDDQNQELNLDLFPNVELQWPPREQWPERWNGVPPYRNFLHFLKRILYLTDEDIANGENSAYHYRWPDFPINLFPNDINAPNDNYRNAIRDFEDDVSDIRYGEHSHDFVNLVDESLDSLGGEYDFSQEASWFNVTPGRDENGLYYALRSRIYVNNNIRHPDDVKGATYHESLNQLVIGRDSSNPRDVQNAGFNIVLSNNDKLLLIAVKNIPPYYRKLLNHREFEQ